MSRINQEIYDAIQEIKKVIAEGKSLSEEEMEIILLTTLLEEES